MTVRISGALSEFVASNVGENGVYENVSEYVRDLIRRDKERAEREAFERLKADLTRAFAAPDESYQPLAAAEVIAASRLDDMAVRIQEAASLRLDEVYRYTRDPWGEDQADRYVVNLFAAFDKIVSHGVSSGPVPAEFGVEGYYFRQAHHFTYWRRLPTGEIGIMTIPHERMHQVDRFREDRGG